MPDDRKKRNETSGSGDAKLRSFLRQAAAIIASTRGLNDESQRKLHSLSDHLGLSDEQYSAAMVRLKQPDHAAFKLNHWEKDFVKQLKKRFRRLPNKILKVSTEEKIIRIAQDKYQIDETRARLLIDHYVEQQGIGRVNTEDAIGHVKASIEQLVGSRTLVSPPYRERLLKVGENWGLDGAEVDALIEEYLLKRRPASEGRGLTWAWVLGAMALLLAVAGGSGVLWQMGWIHFDGWQVDTDDGVEEGSPPSVVTAAWWSEESADRVAELLEAGQISHSVVAELKSESTEERARGLSALVDRCLQDLNGPVEQMTVGMLLEEPSEDVVSGVIARMLERLSPVDDHFPSSVRAVREAFGISEILGRWAVQSSLGKRALTVGAATESLADAVWGSFRFDRAPVSISEYRMRAGSVMANRFWAHLAGSSWASPGRAAALLPPLYEMTSDTMLPRDLKQYRSRTLFSILKGDQARWRILQPAIASAIEVSDEVKLQHWFALFEANRDREWRAFAGGELAKRISLAANQSVEAEVKARRIEFARRQHAPLIRQSEKVLELAESALSELNLGGRLDRPDLIARMAWANNLLMAFEREFRSGSGSYSETEHRLGEGVPELRTLIGLRGESRAPAPPLRLPSPSETENLHRWIAKLESGSTTATAKRAALGNVAESVGKFSDIEYADASVMARYLLGNLNLESALNVEEHLKALGGWPMLGMAIADEIGHSEVPEERARMIAGLHQGRVFSGSGAADWRNELQDEIIAAVAIQMARNVEQNPTPVELDWRRLQIYLPELLRDRARLVSRAKAPNSVSGSVLDDLEQGLNSVWGSDVESAARDQRILHLIEDQTAGELEALAVAEQLFVEAVLQRLAEEFPGAKAAAKDIELELLERPSSESNAKLTVGVRLLLLERSLLKALLIRHRTIVEQKINEM